MVYEPREDSELLARAVREHARGRVLDVGTGSGVLALAAQKSDAVTSVAAVDIDAEAVRQARRRGVDAARSDRFENVSGVYDTIVCNPPYLPSSEEAPDPALDGGPRGHEWTLSFLDEAQEHLSRDGQVLLLVSSRTGPAVVEQYLVEHAWRFAVVAEESLFFERLFVYRLSPLFADREVSFVARGRRSAVYRSGGEALKVAAREVVAVREERMLSRANELGLGPSLRGRDGRVVAMEYVEGPLIGDFVEEASAAAVQSVLDAVFGQCRVLDEAGINKDELTNPYKHVVVSADGPVLIDWERARATHRPQNVNQLREYVKRLRGAHEHLSGLSVPPVT